MDTTHIGLIGCGQWGTNIAKHLTDLGCKVYLHDENNEKARELAKSFGSLSNEGEILSLCDSVIIATTSTEHSKLINHYLDLGMNIYCVKPFCFDCVTGDKLLYSAKEKNLVLDCGYIYRESDGYKMLNYLVNNQALEKIYFKFLNSKPARTDSNIIFNIGIHYLDLIANIFGLPNKLTSTFENNFGDIRLMYEKIDLDVDIFLANSTKVKSRCCFAIYNRGNGIEKIDFDINQKDILRASLEKFLFRIKNKHVYSKYDDLFAIRLCELSELSNKENGKTIDVM